MKQKNGLWAVLEGNCPRCRTGKMFVAPVYKLSKFHVMHEQCGHCGLRYQREPGFFYVAMYVSYAISVAILLVTTFLLYHLANDPALNINIITVSIVSAVTYPINFRISRIIFLHLFGGVKFQRD